MVVATVGLPDGALDGRFEWSCGVLGEVCPEPVPVEPDASAELPEPVPVELDASAELPEALPVPPAGILSAGTAAACLFAHPRVLTATGV